MQKEDFQLVVDYVAANFDEGYLDTQKVGQGEYYYGASSVTWQLECKRIYA